MTLSGRNRPTSFPCPCLRDQNDVFGQANRTCWVGWCFWTDGRVATGLAVGHEIRLYDGRADEQEDVERDPMGAFACGERLFALDEPAGGAGGDSGELDGDVWDVGEQARTVRAECATDQYRWHGEVCKDDSVGDHAGRATPLCAEQSEGARPDTVQRVVRRDRGDKQHRRWRVMRGGECQVQHTAHKRTTTGHQINDHGAPGHAEQHECANVTPPLERGRANRMRRVPRLLLC